MDRFTHGLTFRADNKHITVVTSESESRITTLLKELADRLDSVGRSVVA